MSRGEQRLRIKCSYELGNLEIRNRDSHGCFFFFFFFEPTLSLMDVPSKIKTLFKGFYLYVLFLKNFRCIFGGEDILLLGVISLTTLLLVLSRIARLVALARNAIEQVTKSPSMEGLLEEEVLKMLFFIYIFAKK